MFASVRTLAPIDVHITGGPTALDWIVSGTTILAGLVSLAAIIIAIRARKDLVLDRRHTFELSLLLELYTELENTGMPQVCNLYPDLLPSNEIPAVRTMFAAQLHRMPMSMTGDNLEWGRRRTEIVPLAREQILDAIAKRVQS